MESRKGPIVCGTVLGAALVLLGSLGVTSSARAGTTNPVPFINQPLVPDAVTPGGTGFTLTVNGTGFAMGSVVNWNGSARATSFVSSSRLTATILDSDIATPSTASATVFSPSPGGGTSNVAFFEVTPSAPAIGFIPSSFGAGSGAFSVATGDFNQDGKLDVPVANPVTNTVTVFLGNGNGTFQAPVDYPTGTQPPFGTQFYEPSSVAVGDFNGDGKLDLAVSNEKGCEVAIGVQSDGMPGDQVVGAKVFPARSDGAAKIGKLAGARGVGPITPGA